VEDAIKNICTYFSKHPDKTSYSLGINDGSGHCDCKKCLARDFVLKRIQRFWSFCV
jgi:hypothetical protein